MRDFTPDSPTPLESLARMAQRMGQIQTSAGDVKDLKFACKSGAASRDGLSLQFSWFMFCDAFHGAPALVKWLEQQGCKRFTYKLAPSGYPDPDVAP